MRVNTSHTDLGVVALERYGSIFIKSDIESIDISCVRIVSWVCWDVSFVSVSLRSFVDTFRNPDDLRHLRVLRGLRFSCCRR